MMDYVCRCPDCGTLYENHKSGNNCDRLIIDGDSVKKCDGYLQTEDIQDARLGILRQEDVEQMQSDIEELKTKAEENEEFREEYIAFLQSMVKDLSEKVCQTEEDKKKYREALEGYTRYQKVKKNAGKS